MEWMDMYQPIAYILSITYWHAYSANEHAGIKQLWVLWNDLHMISDSSDIVYILLINWIKKLLFKYWILSHLFLFYYINNNVDSIIILESYIC